MSINEGPYDALILGGGVTGLTYARTLARAGQRICIVEPNEQLGGNQQSWAKDGYTFDIGAFFFTRNGPFLETFAELGPLFLDAKPRFGRLNPHNRLLTYPIKPKELLRDLSPLEIAAFPLDLAFSRLRYRRMRSAGDFARFYLGNLIYDRTGLKNYIERFFSSSDATVDIDFARKRMRWIADAASLRNRLRPQRARRVESGAVQTCVRPEAGFATLYAAIAELLDRDGVSVRTSVVLEGLKRTPEGFELMTASGAIRSRRVIGTLPGEVMAALAGLPDIETPPTLDLLTLFARAPERLATPHGVLFNFTREGRWKRLTLHSRFYAGYAHDHMSIEITSLDGAAEPVETHLAAVTAQLQAAGILSGPLELLGHSVTGHAYPLYRQGAMATGQRLQARLRAFGIEPAGRQGNYDYIPSADLAVKLVRAEIGAAAIPATGVPVRADNQRQGPQPGTENSLGLPSSIRR